MREIERIESRVLAALRFVDAATGSGVDAPLTLVAPSGTAIFRNRSRLYVISHHAPLAHHEAAFLEPPALPAAGTLTLTLSVRDPADIYLARTVQVNLPRNAQLENGEDDDFLFQPVEVALYRSPAASVSANWAPVRVSLTETASGDALGGALVRVVSNGRILARGLSDWRGEALVPVVGVPITTWSDDEDTVIVTEIDATLEILFDGAAGSLRTPAAQLAAARAPTTLPTPDPVAIENNPASARTAAPVRLAAGRPLALAIHLGLPG